MERNMSTHRFTGRKREAPKTTGEPFTFGMKTSIFRKKWCFGVILWARMRTARPCQLENTPCPFNSFFLTTSLPHLRDLRPLKDTSDTPSKPRSVNLWMLVLSSKSLTEFRHQMRSDDLLAHLSLNRLFVRRRSFCDAL